MIPEHHTRYARAWSLYQDPSLDDEARRILEDEMDAAQNHFSWGEFRSFKTTLPGFVQHWRGLKQNAMQILETLKP